MMLLAIVDAGDENKTKNYRSNRERVKRKRNIDQAKFEQPTRGELGEGINRIEEDVYIHIYEKKRSTIHTYVADDMLFKNRRRFW